MHAEYLGLLILAIAAALVCGAMVTLSWVLGPKTHTPYKSSPYECGVAPAGDTNERFPVKFYLTGIVFILFDVEVVFLWPWMTTYRGAETSYIVFTFIAFFIYMLMWILSDIYAVRVGAFDWDESTSLDEAKLGVQAVGPDSAEVGPLQRPAVGVGGGTK